MDLNALLHAKKLQTSADRRVLNRAIAVHIFDFRVGNAAVVFEKWRQVTAGDVTTLVNRRGEYRTAMLTVPNRIISATAEKGDAQGSTRDNHALVFLFRTLQTQCGNHVN